MAKESPSKGPEKKKRLSPEELKSIKAGVERAEKLADLLDEKYLDPLIGFFFPEGGDAAMALAGLYIIYEAKRAGMPTYKLVKMLGISGFDWLAGSIPIVGDLFDVLFKSNKMNAAELRKHFEEIQNDVDTTEEDEELLVEKERGREKKDLKGLKRKVQKFKKAA